MTRRPEFLLFLLALLALLTIGVLTGLGDPVPTVVSTGFYAALGAVAGITHPGSGIGTALATALSTLDTPASPPAAAADDRADLSTSSDPGPADPVPAVLQPAAVFVDDPTLPPIKGAYASPAGP